MCCVLSIVLEGRPLCEQDPAATRPLPIERALKTLIVGSDYIGDISNVVGVVIFIYCSI